MITIRDFNANDKSFVYATWLRGLYYGGSDFYSLIDKSVFFPKYQQILSILLDKPGVKIDVACLSDDVDVILGYVVYEPQMALHYVFVKESWRRQGLATKLVPKGLQCVTHLTKLGNEIRHKYNLTFNPFAI